MFFACGGSVLFVPHRHYSPVAFGATLSATPCCAQTPQGFSIGTQNKQYCKTENNELTSQKTRKCSFYF